MLSSYPRCPKCKNSLRPSKLELGRWVCKLCNEMFEEENIVYK